MTEPEKTEASTESTDSTETTDQAAAGEESTTQPGTDHHASDDDKAIPEGMFKPDDAGSADEGEGGEAETEGGGDTEGETPGATDDKGEAGEGKSLDQLLGLESTDDSDVAATPAQSKKIEEQGYKIANMEKSIQQTNELLQTLITAQVAGKSTDSGFAQTDPQKEALQQLAEIDDGDYLTGKAMKDLLPNLLQKATDQGVGSQALDEIKARMDQMAEALANSQQANQQEQWKSRFAASNPELADHTGKVLQVYDQMVEPFKAAMAKMDDAEFNAFSQQQLDLATAKVKQAVAQVGKGKGGEKGEKGKDTKGRKKAAPANPSAEGTEIQPKGAQTPSSASEATGEVDDHSDEYDGDGNALIPKMWV